MNGLYRTYADALRDQRYPLVFLDLDLLESNARQICAHAGSRVIRLASKSIRSSWVLRHLLNFDRRFQGIMAFCVSEAVWLAKNDFENILIGYPSVESSEFDQAAEFLLAQKKLEPHMKECPISFMVCSEDHLKPIIDLAKKTAITVPVCLDIDHSLSLPGLHFGVKRSPLRSTRAVMDLAHLVYKSPGLKLWGFMGYEAQIAGVPDIDPKNWLKNPIIRLLKKISARKIRALRGKIISAAKDMWPENAETLLFNGGGTGSLRLAAKDPYLTEVTAGSGFYSPGLFDHYAGLSLQPALGFGLRVTRAYSPNWMTCNGGGYVASGATDQNKQPQPYLPEGLRLSPLEGAGEVQTPITGNIRGLKIGDPVFFRHAKAGELCERFNEIHLIRAGKYCGAVLTYRGEGKAFL